MSDQNDPIAQLSPAPLRRHVSTLLMLFLSGVFLSLVVSGRVETLASQVVALALGVAALLVTLRSHQSRNLGLVLTDTGLFDTDGHLLVALDQIRSVDRGAFAFKPSNGFVLRLHQKAKSGWIPGLWWAFGTRMGIGGVSNPAESRAMADKIGLILAGLR